ncbi:hypothetical protein [Pyrobaculum ferrireducens]|jgi:hypothetical protein|uniref:Uncharacterized protein n=1 Tax=Pyrobaculum ferrireducens TaxID=1104324 RepID=G7VFR1_9CREN|nr:hypothetical protein [Pyrobaculum ferrireducens]AET34267.1 hypothetical protein P186_2891 [Pyrobaculum ferrireducens]
MLIRRRGARRVAVVAPEGRFEVGVPLEEVADFLKRLWPWEVGRHVELSDGELVFRDRVPFERALVYLLARRSRLPRGEAEVLAASLRLHEVSLIADAFLYRLWLCRAEGGNCRRIVDAFAKIAKTYREALP